jgi:type III secretion system low calcium response chaperone LcrH/SycD
MADETTPAELVSQEQTREYIKEAVGRLGPQVPKEEKKEVAKLFVKILEQGESPKKAMGISDEELAQLYSFAYHQFTSENYEDARELFKFLLTLDPANHSYATCLGVCHHRLNSYEFALQAYMLASFLAPEDPLPCFYAYDCLMNLKNEASAASMLSNVIAKAGDNKLYETIKKNAATLLERLEQKLLNEHA